MTMAYKPTPPKWVAIRMAIFAVWPGLPVFLLAYWLGLNALHSLLIAAVLVAILDWLVERFRFLSGADGE